MPRSAKDIQLTELKDTIAKLNELITTQTKSMDSLQKTIEELRQELNNKQAEVDYLKAKLFGNESFRGTAGREDSRDHRTGNHRRFRPQTGTKAQSLL